jgi:RNA polymerase sigma factor (sigma-70 family)
MQSIHWNIITRNVEPDQELQARIRQKIARLEKHLKAVPPERLHLQNVLEKDAKKHFYTAALTLTSPGDIFYVEKYAPDLLKAFDDALHTLEFELDNRSTARVREHADKRSDSRERSAPPSPGIFTPEPQSEGAGPQNFQEVIRKFVRHHYQRLLHHARRDIRHDELTSDLPAGAIDPRDVVDEVARQAEASANRKPDRVSWRVWIYHLLHEELRRQRRVFKQKQAEEIPTEKRTTIPELKMKTLQPMEQMVEKVMEPQVIHIEDIVSNPQAVPPDELVEEKELLEELQNAVQSWPRLERDVFELYFVQGFEAEEIAQVTRQPLKKVKEIIATVQSRLRHEMLEEEAVV